MCPFVRRVCVSCASVVRRLCVGGASGVRQLCVVCVSVVRRVCVGCASGVRRLCVGCASGVRRVCAPDARPTHNRISRNKQGPHEFTCKVLGLVAGRARIARYCIRMNCQLHLLNWAIGWTFASMMLATRSLRRAC